MNQHSRRSFFKQSLAGALALTPVPFRPQATASGYQQLPWQGLRYELAPYRHPERLDLQPARWIWYPSERTLANSMMLFRNTFTLDQLPASAAGWILAESRYILFVNGKRVQFGPAPNDPRYPEADPIELAPYLQKGKNCIGVQVLYYGHGDGTWPTGKPGLLFYIANLGADLYSSRRWSVHLARSWMPGQYKRWYLRALQEEFDARIHPSDWHTAHFSEDKSWLSAMELEGAASEPALATSYTKYETNPGAPGYTEIRPRSVELLEENFIPATRFEELAVLVWNIPSRTYFEMVVPDAYRVKNTQIPIDTSNLNYASPVLPDGQSIVLTYSWQEQWVGWPRVIVEATEGTVIEMLVQEAHELHTNGGPALMNNHFHAWSRFICREGENVLEPFDFESVRWLQLHVHGHTRPVKIKQVAGRRRKYPFPYDPDCHTNDPKINRLLSACVNTMVNSAQETLVDGMGRERQQYSGDVGHQLHCLFSAFGDTALARRFLRTYSQGLTKDGFFLDCWPAYDRLNRLAQRQLDLTPWGPLLDHGVGFAFDCYHYYMYSGDNSPFEEVFPRLERFVIYLNGLQQDGLLPVEDIGIPTVWIDHDAYQKQRHKQCAFNLYASAMLQYAFVPLAQALGKTDQIQQARKLSQDLWASVVEHFWDPERQIFVNNLPWLDEEGGKVRTCDRSLATALLYDQCPDNKTGSVIKVLVEKPDHLGLSYPPNAGWYLWALARAHRPDKIIDDFHSRWSDMESVQQNNTMQEAWHARPDTTSQWSHVAVAPLYATYMSLAGITPLQPGCSEVAIFPQPGPLEELNLSYHTPKGPIQFQLSGKAGNKSLTLNLPRGCTGLLTLPADESVKLMRDNPGEAYHQYRIPEGQKTVLKRLKYL